MIYFICSSIVAASPCTCSGVPSAGSDGGLLGGAAVGGVFIGGIGAGILISVVSSTECLVSGLL